MKNNKAIRPGSQAFSLIEFSIAATCAAILLAAAVPYVHFLRQHWMLWGNARSLEVSLQWGRMHAISANTSILFEVIDDGRQYYWMDPASGDRYESTARRLPGPIRIVGFPRRPLRFYQHGNAAPAGTYTIQGDAGSYSIIVSPGGRIRFQRN